MPKRNDTRVGRFYEIEDGVELPSVTSILGCIGKPALVNWAANTERELVVDASTALYGDLAGTPKMSAAAYRQTLITRLGHEKAHKRELAKAAEIGTQAHALIEWNLRRSLGQKVGEEPRVEGKALWAFMAAEDWIKAVHLKPLAMEQTVWSRTHSYAGTLDLLGEVNGELAVCDFKTSKAVYPESFLQVAAYAHALAEMGHSSPRAGWIVRLPKVESDPAFEAVRVPDFGPLFETFLHVIEVWRWSFAQEQARQAARVAA